MKTTAVWKHQYHKPATRLYDFLSNTATSVNPVIYTPPVFHQLHQLCKRINFHRQGAPCSLAR